MRAQNVAKEKEQKEAARALQQIEDVSLLGKHHCDYAGNSVEFCFKFETVGSYLMQRGLLLHLILECVFYNSCAWERLGIYGNGFKVLNLFVK